ncbi:MAG: serine hydrolase domain-containing protein [bacterium]
MKTNSTFSNLLAFLSAFSLITSISIGQVSNSKELTEKINSYVNPLVKKNVFSGTIFIAHGDSIIFSKGYGLADRAHDITNNLNTVFKIGSMTKQFTATAIMQLVDQMAITTDSKLSEFIPDYPNGDKITIHHLLTHTSGISNYTKLADFGKFSLLPAKIEELISHIKNLPLEFEPGTKFKYNDSGYLLLTYIIEKVSGISYSEYLQKNIFDKLEMKNSGYLDSQIIKNLASGYVYNSKLKSMVNADYFDTSVPQGAGGLYSTVLDLYKWDRSFYKDEIISKESKEKMFSFQTSDYGYGWGKELRKGGRVSIGHNGIINGFSSIIHRFVNDNIVIIVLANIENFEVNEVFDKIPAIFFNEE